MKNLDDTRKILKYHCALLHEDINGIGFAIFDRKHHRILTSQTDLHWSKKVSQSNTDHDPVTKIITTSCGDKIITPNVSSYSFYSCPSASYEMTKRKESGTENPLILIRRLDEHISTVFTIYYKNSVSALYKPCFAEISHLNQLISNKICIRLLNRNKELNISSDAQEVLSSQFSREQLFESYLMRPIETHKDNRVLVVAV